MPVTDKSLSSATKLRLAPGTYLFKEGEDSRDLYVLQFGKIRVFKREGGVEIDLDLVEPGEVVGEVAAIDGGCRSASAVALETSELLVVSVDDFRKILKQIPEWFRKIATILVQRLRERTERIHTTVSGDNTPHVAALVSLMTYSAFAAGAGGGCEINQKTVENEVADLLGIQMGEVNEAIDRLVKKGLLDVEKGKVLVTDRAKLDAFGNVVFTLAEDAPAT